MKQILNEPPSRILPPLFLLATGLKILLFPSYRSTDFDVHRNWLAVTRQLPISEWYFNDVDGGTVHTLDYPPAFAYFEYVLSNNPVVDWFLAEGDRCLELLPDSDNEPSEECVIYQRSTVVLFDVVFWAGTYFACWAYHYGKPSNFTMTSFCLIVLNPALLWLDHIHFQYNGMMIGVFLASLGCLLMGNNVTIKATPENPIPKQPLAYHLYHLTGAALYATLLNFKHLYLPLAPLYFCYLLEKYCLTNAIPVGKSRKEFLPQKFLLLGVVTVTFLVLPWVPFVKGSSEPIGQIQQILRRLFPFGRGLVHDYWAGNVWAIYSLLDRIFRAATTKILPKVLPGLAQFFPDHLPEPSPLVCAILLFASIVPGLQAASLHLTNQKLVESVVYVSFCAFMLAYHVHEKAILTALIPLGLVVEPSPRGEYHNILFWHLNLWGLLGLFPLLFRPIELTLKLTCYLAYMALVSYLLHTPPRWLEDIQYGSIGMVGLVILLLEFVPIQGKWEFLPLMATSIACASGLLGCWGMSSWLLARVPRTTKRVYKKQ
mmetsp:Transcript_14521/g.36481  ORF Transcript_14521/g.36481 Transcript_14521/m.36481 type:complete len:543 (+) Transcript_14521:137-1765(+)